MEYHSLLGGPQLSSSCKRGGGKEVICIYIIVIFNLFSRKVCCVVVAMSSCGVRRYGGLLRLVFSNVTRTLILSSAFAVTVVNARGVFMAHVQKRQDVSFCQIHANRFRERWRYPNGLGLSAVSAKR